ncbi:hypothetical protein PA598K_03872 [Paenibacillus sp. 598K]|uniref:ketopantoate reductase family protein n=1 Tax=Paenibacillus sp. 598K TaxID=1117987 RepID=UPI000FFA67E7|nr:2-dehydropantoate 2-reductase [Paenibacillus sp. 598K]GBF75459.1 hypothetical protein PA598K_03872 [Paenibacillus sp. 598K]
MRIWIIGAGAIGMLYAARLAAGGTVVRLLTRTPEQAEALRVEGIKWSGSAAHGHEAVQASAIVEELEDFGPDAVLLTVKQVHIDDRMILKLASLVPQTADIYCLQNGIGHLERLRAELPGHRILAAVTTDGALRVGQREVRHTGVGELWLEEIPSADREAAERQKKLLVAMKKAGIGVFLSNQMENRMYRKLLLNSVINPLTALFGVKNGELPDDPERLAVMRALHEEAAAVLQRAGLPLDGDEWERLLALCRLTADNESSMLRDVRSGRPTEIDWINGGVVALARQLGLETPLNEAIVAQVKQQATDR